MTNLTARQCLDFCELMWREVSMDDTHFDRLEGLIAALTAQVEQAAQPNPLARRCYLMSEAHLSGHRLIIGFERLEDLQDAHAFLAAPQPKD